MALDAATKILILATNGFERVELTVPRDRLAQAGATVHVASPGAGDIRSWEGDDWGPSEPSGHRIADVASGDYDLLVLPGGQINPDILRTDVKAVQIVKDFVAAGKPVAAICHGPWLLVEADVAKGREMTAWHSIRKDIENAGATWADREVVVSDGIITSRSPEDLDAFVTAITKAI